MPRIPRMAPSWTSVLASASDLASQASAVGRRPVAGPTRDVVAAVGGRLASPAEPGPLVVETSGSTGRPKRVVLSRRAVLASVRATERRLGGSGRWLLTLPAS